MCQREKERERERERGKEIKRDKVTNLLERKVGV